MRVALMETLGLKLEPRKLPVQILARISHQVFASQMSCSASSVFELVRDRTRSSSPRGLPVKRQEGLALALIRSGEAFSGRLARRAPCGAWN